MLRIVSEPYEVECGICDGHGAYPIYTGSDEPEHYTQCSCNQGKQMVRLEGWVDSSHDFIKTRYNELWRTMGYDHTSSCRIYRNGVVPRIIKAHLEDCLPAELYISETNPMGLQEVGVKDD